MRDNYKSVFILGAGASRDAGIPVMSKFLDAARDYHSTRLVGTDIAEFNYVFKIIHELKGVSFYSSLDLNNIETVLSVLELGEQIGGVDRISKRAFSKARRIADRLIGKTIDHFMVFPEEPCLPQTYELFTLYPIKHLESYGENAGIITFNYDCALDYALEKHGVAYDYCLNEPNNQNVMPYLKMHGSINWVKDGSVIKPRNFTDNDAVCYPGEGVRHHIASRIFDDADRGDGDGIFIVPPLLNKSKHQSVISSVWGKAAKCLQEAEAIYVIGYSLPETDLFFKYFLSLAMHSPASIRRFWVFDPDERVGERFRQLLGGGLNEPRFQYKRNCFRDAVEIINENLTD